MSARRSTIVALPWIALLSAACARPATTIEVHVDSDIQRSETMTIRVAALRAGGSPQWQSLGTFGPSARTQLPGSFSVVATREDEGAVRLMIEAEMDPPRRRVLRRELLLTFQRGLSTSTRVFLSARCSDHRTGCISPGECTASLLCVERQLTCGDDGTCVAPTVVTSLPDAGFDARSDGTSATPDATAVMDTAPPPECVEGATRCAGAVFQRCAGGAFAAVATCASDALCASGGCNAPACSPNQLRCYGRDRERCNGALTGWDRVERCANNVLCTPSRCVAPTCATGEWRCNGAARETCNGDRNGWSVVQSCASSALCTPGGCNPPACAVGEYRCDGEALQSCRADRTGWSTIRVCSGCDRCGDTPPGCYDACA